MTVVRNIIWVFVLLLVSIKGSAQFKITADIPDPEQVIREKLVGEGVEIISISYHGGRESIGIFDNGKETNGHPKGLGIDKGLLMTTGSAIRIDTFVGDGSEAKDVYHSVGNFANAPNYPNLLKLAGSDAEVRDFSIIRIQFIPETDTFRLNYVWASEEYPKYVCSQFNDVFGFILSGPEINGDFENQGKNIAVVPNTNLPVTINNVNSGELGTGDTVDRSNCSDEALRGETVKYFINNLDFGSQARPAFNGYTVPLEAKAAVVPCETYTMELIISDIRDDKQDSGVFFEQGSFRTETLDISVVTANADNTLVEGCESAEINLDNKNRFAEPVSLVASIDGTAELNTDYQLFFNDRRIDEPSQMILPPNESKMNIRIEALEDNTTEDTETIKFSYRSSLFLNQSAVCDNVRDTIELYIKDDKLSAKKLTKAKDICRGAKLELDGSILTKIPKGKAFKQENSLDLKPEKTDIFSSLKVSGEDQIAIGSNSLPTVCINVDHKTVKDLDITLISPNGKELLLVSNLKKDWQRNFTNTCFSPESAKSILDGNPPFTGDYSPVGDWSNLHGALINGTWKLKIKDKFKGFTGTLTSWSISFKNPYSVSYAWTPNDAITDTNLPKVTVNPSSDTKYVLEIKDIYGCILRDSTVVNVSDGNEYDHSTVDVRCHGEATGEVSFSSSDTGMKYKWGDGNTSSKRTNLLAGDYRLKMVGKSGCETDTLIKISQPTALKNVPTIKDAGCQGENQGAIKLEVSGGTPNYTISWDHDNTLNTYELNGLPKGKYTGTITDANMCTLPFETTISEAAPFTVSVTTEQNISCYGSDNGKLALNITDNSNDLSFKWEGPNGYSNSQGTIDNLIPGTYKVTITEKDGCVVDRSFELTQPDKIEALLSKKTDVACHGDATGTISLDVKGGVQPYRYSIDDGNTYGDNKDISNLAAASYPIMVKDDNQCEHRLPENIEIQQPPKLKIDDTKNKDAGCSGENKGVIDLSISGGVPDYTVQWTHSNNQDLQLSNLAPGNYEAKIIDKNGCILPYSTKISEITPFDISVHNKNDISCAGAKDGALSLKTIGTTDQVSYSWSGPNGFANDTSEITQLDPGTYHVVVSDKGCDQKESYDIIEPDDVAVTHDYQNVQCYGDATGSISLSVVGGTKPYLYSIDNGLAYTSKAYTGGLEAGAYKVWVKDANNCLYSVGSDIVIEQPPMTTTKADSVIKITYGESASLVGTTTLNDDQISQIEWSPPHDLTCADCLETKATPDYTTSYQLMVVDTVGCVTRSTSRVSVNRIPRVDMPDIFSPNGIDNPENERIRLFTDNTIVQQILYLRIYNRWGDLVFDVADVEPNSKQLEWNGTYNGSDAPQGVYSWIALIGLKDNVEKIYTGNITLVK